MICFKYNLFKLLHSTYIVSSLSRTKQQKSKWGKSSWHNIKWFPLADVMAHPITPVEKKEQANFAEMDPSLRDKLTKTTAGYTNLLLTQERN